MAIIPNKSPVDKWSIGHIAIGIILGLLNLIFWIALAISIMWELIEIPLERRYTGSWLTKNPESNINRISDIFFNMIGWAIGMGIFLLIW